jgi:hypothetical protein
MEGFAFAQSSGDDFERCSASIVPARMERAVTVAGST